MSLRSRVYGFIPTSITGCQVWLDGADTSSIAFSSGSNVSTWSDKSGNGRNATVYAGTPTYTSALGMTFNGSSSLQITYTASPTIETMFVVIKFNSVAAQGDILSGTAAGQREYLMYFPYSPGTIYLGRHSTAPSGAINGGTVTTGLNYLLGYVFNGTGNTISFFQSGNTITSGTPQFTYGAGGTISVIGSYNGGGYLQGQIYEMIIYSTALGTTERQQVEGYLAQKWGLRSSLPLGHPGLGETIYRADYTKQNAMTARPYYTAFSPKSLPNCLIWFDAADSTTLGLTGTTVNTWTSKGSYTGNAVANIGTVSSGTIKQNGLNVISFPAGSQITYTVAMPNQARAWFFVMRNTTQMASNKSYWLPINQSGGGQDSIVVVYGSGGSTYNIYMGPAGISITVNTLVMPEPYNVMKTYVMQNSAVSTASNAVSIDGSTYTLNNNSLASGFATGSLTYSISTNWPNVGMDLCEMIVYNGEITATQRQQVESYLAQKWGLTASLPGGHLNATQPAGALTLTALTNFRIFSRLRTPQFLPTAIAGLQMWMDAADSSADSMTLSGSTVTVWKDKSGLGNNTTARSGTSTLTSSAINGKSAISMAGGYFTGPLATANTGTQLHAFGVMTIDSSSGVWPRPLALGRPGVDDYNSSTTTFAIIRYSGSQAVAIGRNGQYLNVGIPAYSTPFLVQSSHNGATEYMSVNGNLTVSSLNTGQTGNFNITSYALGVNTNTGDYFPWNGFYGEVMYFNVQLSDANRQKIEGYLAWKWGLESLLPAGHPHKSAAP
jgi:hypothetical protein